jgi:ABC-type Fe3+-hydroxamate transport system substrate-binding protein
MATAAAEPDAADSGSTIATVDLESGRLVDRRPLAYLVVWGARNERRAVVLEKARADELAAVQHGQVVPLVAGAS